MNTLPPPPVFRDRELRAPLGRVGGATAIRVPGLRSGIRVSQPSFDAVEGNGSSSPHGDTTTPQYAEASSAARLRAVAQKAGLTLSLSCFA